MKIQITIELDLPDNMQEWSDPEIGQELFTNYVNYVHSQHLIDTLQWMTQTAESGGHLYPELIAKNHKMWANISNNVKWSFTRNK